MLPVDQIYHADAFEMLPRLDDESVDLIVCDGPFGVTSNKWDRVGSIQEFNLELLRIFSEKLVDGGALYLFGKPDCIDFIDYRRHLNLRSKIVWYQPSRLAQGRLSFTNNYDVICYFIHVRLLRATKSNSRSTTSVQTETCSVAFGNTITVSRTSCEPST